MKKTNKKYFFLILLLFIVIILNIFNKQNNVLKLEHYDDWIPGSKYELVITNNLSIKLEITNYCSFVGCEPHTRVYSINLLIIYALIIISIELLKFILKIFKKK